MSTYTRVTATGPIAAVRDDGIKLGDFWWNVSKINPLDISRLRVGQAVTVEGDETPDGRRRWLDRIELVSGHDTGRPAPPDLYDPDPDDLPAEPARQPSAHRPPPPAAQQAARQMVADRLACVQIAASVLGPWWTKKGTDPDGAVLAGLADYLCAYVRDGLATDADPDA